MDGLEHSLDHIVDTLEVDGWCGWLVERCSEGVVLAKNWANDASFKRFRSINEDRDFSTQFILLTPPDSSPTTRSGCRSSGSLFLS